MSWGSVMSGAVSGMWNVKTLLVSFNGKRKRYVVKIEMLHFTSGMGQNKSKKRHFF